MKIIIWGHKLHSHTHSYIHASFYKAFKHMGYETFWFDNKDDVSSFDFSNSLFITEGQVDKNIPKRKDCLYVLHNCNSSEYITLNYIELQVYTIDSNGREEQNDYIFFNNKTLYMCWATDFLPHEINTDIHYNNTNYNDIYWVGTVGGGVHGNINELNPFIDRAKQKKKNFIHSNPWATPKSFEQNCQMIRDSYLAPTIVGAWQKEKHYIPCRIFKNISYGKLGLTNSPAVKEMFGDMVVYSDNTSELFDLAENKLNTITHKEMKDSMEFVKNNHTYINRCRSILECFGL